MGAFDSFADAAFQIKTEGENITISFSRGVPATGQGTVNWNIPAPAHGCQTEDGRGAYCGMLVLLREGGPLLPEHIPQDGTYYTADPSADSNIHVGDKIGDALVVGAFYEGETKSKGEELTTSFVVSDLKPNTAYYVAGYATDCQARYHSDGTRAYSDEYGSPNEPDISAVQTIQLPPTGSGVLLTDGTGLVPSTIYEFDVVIDDTFPTGENYKIAEITVDGLDVLTYEDLLNEINRQISLVDNPPQSPYPPNAGQFYWDAVNEQLYQFDGVTHNEVDSLVEPTDPAVIAVGEYWYDTANDNLLQWSGAVWNIVTDVIRYHEDPLSLGCDDYWFNGTIGYNWNGTTWCENTTIVDSVDPSLPVTPICGTFWYNEATSQMYSWSTEQGAWETTAAVYWDVDPLALTVGSYWFDLDTDLLFSWNGATWDAETAIIQEEEPAAPAPGALWYTPSTETLQEWNDTTTTWDPLTVLVWPGDPTDVTSCDLWWNSTTDILYVRDVVNNEWDQVAAFVQSPTDPALAPVIEVGTVWYDSSESKLFRWEGSIWVEVTFIEYPTDPTQPTTGTAWYNTSTNAWSIWDTPTPGVWNSVNPVDSDMDPTAILNGTYWYDTTTNTLNVRNGITWLPVTFTTMPLTPTRGEVWYDSTENVLKEWDGTDWVPATPVATARLDTNGNVRFESTESGSGTIIFVPNASGGLTGGGGIPVTTGYADFNLDGVTPNIGAGTYYGQGGNQAYPTRLIAEGAFLWSHVTQGASILQPVQGLDGQHGIPSYDQLDVGDDGSPDERRELADSLRAQLGYPVIEVELTPYQIDTAIQGALESLRKRSAVAYKRGFFFLDIKPHQQRYHMTNRQIGYHRIVTVTSAHRFTSAFLSTAHGAGVYGQIVLQHLYNMGTYDLTSFHLISQYIEQMEHLFATRLTYHWDEPSRNLDFYSSFVRQERILIDCELERTEQELLTDRWTKSWIERYALSECRIMLAEIRGKYASLPGAGGGVSLNASELFARADADRLDLIEQIDNFIVNDIEDVGMHSTLIIG